MTHHNPWAKNGPKPRAFWRPARVKPLTRREQFRRSAKQTLAVLLIVPLFYLVAMALAPRVDQAEIISRIDPR